MKNNTYKEQCLKCKHHKTKSTLNNISYYCRKRSALWDPSTYCPDYKEQS